MTKAAKLVDIGERIKSTSRQPGPQIKREQPARHTAGASKMVANAPSLPTAAPKITRGPSPAALGTAGRYYVDPATVPRIFGGRIGLDVETGKAWGAQA